MQKLVRAGLRAHSGPDDTRLQVRGRYSAEVYLFIPFRCSGALIGRRSRDPASSELSCLNDGSAGSQFLCI